jgi:hypothetical protein
MTEKSPYFQGAFAFFRTEPGQVAAVQHAGAGMPIIGAPSLDKNGCPDGHPF